ncbi:RluA family pseudouridine synthase [uncultured Polaribacter sp.]|uniref:RluA family pseudouridine synthase n=1 Tax=uncultured Polaribacter sp. TaxID=174711 RepID=UPI002624BA07|nr:RluA family pseudouridine synthase [uncultured Polaribacter sp.]
MNYFQPFKSDISKIKLPKKFTFPFYYKPHPIAKIAASELQEYLEHQKDFTHNFGLNSDDTSLAVGKMFGILVVKKSNGELGYITAFSGKLAENNLPKKFVPPVFNMRTEGSFFTKGEQEIDAINKKLSAIKKSKEYIVTKKIVTKAIKNITDNLTLEKEKLKLRKKDRKARKKIGDTTLQEVALINLKQQLSQESFNDQFYYKELLEYCETKIENKKAELNIFETEIDQLKKQRVAISTNLQQTLFDKYVFLNQKKESKKLLEIFNKPEIKPPAGAGECAAPKLLQHAFLNNLTPICMAEFWWGVSPNAAIRKHKNYYPACQSRCKPILSHMLKGIEMDSNLLIKNLGEHSKLKIIYEDSDILVIDKPTEFLSVPGKEIKDSVYTRIKEKYPKATGPIIVHRLDMSTSGILVLSKTKEANKILQQQFISRTVKKRYVALLNGELSDTNGTIKLPLRVDLEDRPRQLVDFKHGKNAETNWEIIDVKNGKTKVYFYPITGRTHQLRVHAAHKNGLNTPIVGDDLYGTKEKRLHLHAEFIEFYHPTTKQKMEFKIEAPF